MTSGFLNVVRSISLQYKHQSAVKFTKTFLGFMDKESFTWEKLIQLICGTDFCASAKFPPKRKKSNNKKAERFKPKKLNRFYAKSYKQSSGHIWTINKVAVAVLADVKIFLISIKNIFHSAKDFDS